jgi:FKBP12-rapamycin complex-associated protein
MSQISPETALSQILGNLETLEPSAVQAACAGVLAVAESAPAVLLQHLSSLLQRLWPAVHDGRLETREAAARAMRACLDVVGQRDIQLRVRWRALIFEEALTGLLGAEATAHGSLCVLIELLAACRDTIDAAWTLRDSRQRHLRLAVIHLLPRLAAAAPHGLALRWLPALAAHLLQCLQATGHGHEAVRAAALVALGRTSLALGSSAFAEYVTPCALTARPHREPLPHALTTRRRRVRDCVPPAVPRA